MVRLDINGSIHGFLINFSTVIVMEADVAAHHHVIDTDDVEVSVGKELIAYLLLITQLLIAYF